MAYYDIEAILAEQEAVPCSMTADVIKLGHLETGGSGRGDRSKLRKGASVEFPLWLARVLKARNYVAMTHPAAFRSPERLKVDPSVHNLHEASPFFYQFGLDYAVLAGHEDTATLLIEVFQGRYRAVMDMAQNALHEDTLTPMAKLDHLERRLFQSGYQSDKEYQQWLKGDRGRLVAAPAIRDKKRKRP
eukprot:m.115838 g.115838  ORF g.115838 m.115838 type:complete len:189 (+) comp16358_c0_seq1:400-966(+)